MNSAKKNMSDMKRRHTQMLNSSIAGPQLEIDQPSPRKDNFFEDVAVEIDDNIISG